MELEELRSRIEELDEGVTKDNARIRIYRWGGDDDESVMIATRNGYLRLGIEFLKAGVAPDPPYPPDSSIHVDLEYLIDDNSTVFFENFELVETLPPEETAETWKDTVVIYAILTVLVALLLLAVIGAVAVIRWLF
jgi:hypothetical protein